MFKYLIIILIFCGICNGIGINYPLVVGGHTIVLTSAVNSADIISLNWKTFLYWDMLLWYPFVTNNANDYTDNGHDGIILGATYSGNKIGYLFSGAQSITSNPDVTYPFTLSCWVNTSDTDGSFMCLASGSDPYYHAIMVKNAEFIARSYDGTILGAARPSIIDEWAYVVGVYASASSRQIYVNSRASSVITTTESGIGKERMTIGVTADVTPIAYLTGNVDDCRVHNKALTADEIQELYVFTKWGRDIPKPYLIEGLINYYPFNIVVQDEIGPKDGTVSGAIKVDNYYTFDGIDDYLNISYTESITDNFSVVIWFYTTSSGTQVLMDKNASSSSSGREFGLWLNNGKLSVRNLYTSTEATTTVTLGQWNLAVMTISDAETKVYLNGNLDLTISDVFTKGSNGSKINMGRWPYTSNTFPFAGKLDDAYIYNRALTQDEINGILNLDRL